MTTRRPPHEQVNNNDPHRPLVRHASAPAPQTQQAYRESVGTTAATHREDVPYTTDEHKPKRTGYDDGQALLLQGRRPQPVSPDVAEEEADEEDEYDDTYPPRLPSSARRHPGAAPQAATRHSSSTPIPARKSRQPVQDLANLPWLVQIGGQFYRVQDHGTTAPPKRRAYQPPVADRQTEEQVPIPEPESQPQRQAHYARRRFHWLYWVGVTFCTMLIGWAVFTLLGSWLQLKYDDLLYGRPRTFQTDATVGHQDSPTSPSHFQCTNFNKQIQVLEFPGGNSRQAKIYEGPSLLGPGSELTVCILSFRDVNGDGKPDMVLTIGKELFVMINDGTGFREVKAGEHVSL